MTISTDNQSAKRQAIAFLIGSMIAWAVAFTTGSPVVFLAGFIFLTLALCAMADV